MNKVTKATTADMAQWMQGRMDDFTQPVRLSGREMPDFMKREWETIKAIRDLISRAEDVDRLVSAAKEVIRTGGFEAEPIDKLSAALAPFMEKDRGNVPIFNEEGNSNEEEKKI